MILNSALPDPQATLQTLYVERRRGGPTVCGEAAWWGWVNPFAFEYNDLIKCECLG